MRNKTRFILAFSLSVTWVSMACVWAQQSANYVLPSPAVVTTEAAQPISSAVEQIRPFGHDFFTSAPESFNIAPDAPVPDSYVLDGNDRVSIRYWTPTLPEVSYELRVNDKGTVALPGIGDFRAAGYTVSQFRERVGARITEQLKSPSYTVDLIETRTIVVFVTGAARRPGRYTLKAECSLFNVIYAAGGASDEGTLRKVTVIRKGSPVAQTDAYGFLISGRTDRDIVLKDQDAIFFPIAGPRVTVAGQVVRPAIYELVDGTTISGVLEMAGGLRPSAYSRIVRLQRVEDGRRVERTVDARATIAGFSEKTEDIALRDGDVITVENVTGRVADRVSVKGYVHYPGDYSILRTPTVKALLDEAKLKTGAYRERADLTRVLDDGTPVVIPIMLRDLMAGKDVEMQDQDEVVVYANDEKTVVSLVSIEGPVRNPATYRLADGMRAGDLIFASGGLLQDASRDVAHLYRRTGPNSFRLIRICPAQLPRDDDAGNPRLTDQDRLVVYRQKDVEFKRSVLTVLGEVQKPGEFTFYEGMTLYDLLIQAGGPTDMASGTVEVARPVAAGDQLWASSVRIIPLSDVMTGPMTDEPVKAGMLISLPRRQDKLIEPRRVELKGQFKRPGVYALLSEEETLDSLIERAGGLAENSDPFGISFVRRTDQMLSAATGEQIKMVMQTMDQLLPSETGTASLQPDPPFASAQEPQVDPLDTASAQSGGSSVSSRRLAGNVLLVSPRRLTGMPTGKRIALTLEDRGSYLDRIGKMKLADGDVVEVPKLSDVVQVLGAVQSPGPVFYGTGLTAGKYIDRAGGGAPDADMKRAVVIKVSGAVQPLGRTKVIDPGDVIVVASKYQVVQPRIQRTTADILADLLGVALVIRSFD